MLYYLKIANKTFQLETTEPFEIAENIQQFFSDSIEADCISAYYRVFLDQQFELIPDKILLQTPDRVIFEKDSIEYRLHFIPGTNIPFAYYKEGSDGTNEIHILDKAFPQRIISLVFIELMALEKLLLPHDSLVLHSSYIIYNDMAILFSAPSGTGKSTQANLWEEHLHARIINGDRSIIQLTNDLVHVHGLPFCGSSGINLNESAPLAGIVLLEQASENSIEKCPIPVAIRKIFSECSINHWKRESVNNAFNIIEKIVEKTPVYILKCTISKEAVSVLNNELFH